MCLEIDRLTSRSRRSDPRLADRPAAAPDIFPPHGLRLHRSSGSFSASACSSSRCAAARAARASRCTPNRSSASARSRSASCCCSPSAWSCRRSCWRSTANTRRASAVGGLHLNAEAGKGRELFAHSCAVCHTLAAIKSVGRIGPNLDVRVGDDISTAAGRKALVLNAIAEGRARGLGRCRRCSTRARKPKRSPSSSRP